MKRYRLWKDISMMCVWFISLSMGAWAIAVSGGHLPSFSTFPVVLPLWIVFLTGLLSVVYSAFVGEKKNTKFWQTKCNMTDIAYTVRKAAHEGDKIHLHNARRVLTMLNMDENARVLDVRGGAPQLKVTATKDDHGVVKLAVKAD